MNKARLSPRLDAVLMPRCGLIQRRPATLVNQDYNFYFSIIHLTRFYDFGAVINFDVTSFDGLKAGKKDQRRGVSSSLVFLGFTCLSLSLLLRLLLISSIRPSLYWILSP